MHEHDAGLGVRVVVHVAPMLLGQSSFRGGAQQAVDAVHTEPVPQIQAVSAPAAMAFPML